MEDNIIRLEDAVQDDSGAYNHYSLKAWDEMITEHDAAWFMQTHNSLMSLIPCGRMRLHEYVEHINERTNGTLGMIQEQMETLAACAAASALCDKKEFDMKVSYPVIGTDRKDYAVFNGWRLAHFEKIYKFDNFSSPGYHRITNWDFVLCEDGEIYHVTSGYAAKDSLSGTVSADDKFFYTVRRPIYFDIGTLNNQNQAYFIAVSHGAFLTIDQLLAYPEVVSGDYRFQEKDGYEEYIFNFPLQPDGKADIDNRHINELLWSFIQSDMTDDERQKMIEQRSAERKARLADQEQAARAKIENERNMKRNEERKHIIRQVDDLEQEFKYQESELAGAAGIFAYSKRKKIYERQQQIHNKLVELKNKLDKLK